MADITNVSIFEVGIEDTQPVKETKKTGGATVSKEKKPELKVNNEWTVNFPTECFMVTDFVEEIPEEGITLETLREGIERVFPKFSAARTRFDTDIENKRIYPDAFAGSKGAGALTPSFFLTKKEALESTKRNKYLLSNTGEVFKIFDSKLGTFISKVDERLNLKVIEYLYTQYKDKLEHLEESFNFKLPKIPNDIFIKITAFFKAFINKGENFEVACKVFWDTEKLEYIVEVPKQIVTKVSVHLEYSGQFTGRNSIRYLPVLELHSHNVMRAFFSSTDDEDEQEYGLYSVMGRLNRKEIEVLFRVKCGSNSLLIPIEKIIESSINNIENPCFPAEWLDKVTTKKGLYL